MHAFDPNSIPAKSAPPLPSVLALDLNLLKVFHAVFRHRQLTAAAQQLDITPSAVSNALARLKVHCKDRLFVRTQRGVLPTPYAVGLWAAVQQSLSTLEEGLTLKLEFDPATSTRMFRINLADVGQMLMIGDLAATIAKEGSGIGLRTIDLHVSQVEGALLKGEIDIAVGHLSQMTKSLFKRKLVNERFVCVVSSKSRYRGPITFEDFLEGTHIRYSPSAVSLSRLNLEIDRQFKKVGRSQRVALDAAHAFGLSAIVADSEYILTVPARLAAHYQKLAPLEVHPLPIKFPAFDVSLYWHEREQSDPAHRWLRQKFAEAVTES